MTKLRIHFSAPNADVPFHYQHSLTGLFHHWLGVNSLHEEQSFYSLGWLKGAGSIHNHKIRFTNHVTWDIGLPSDELVKRVKSGAENHPFHLFGMKLLKIETLKTPDFSDGCCRFYVNSPVLLRKSAGSGKRRHILFSETESDTLLTAASRRKTERLKLSDPGKLRLTFDRTYKKAKTRLVAIKSTELRGSVCPIIAEGPPSLLRAVWVTGAGELTGSGFGALDHPDHS